MVYPALLSMSPPKHYPTDQDEKSVIGGALEWGGAGRFLVGKRECKRRSGMTRLGWEDNIKMDDSVGITNKVQPCNRIYYSTVH